MSIECPICFTCAPNFWIIANNQFSKFIQAWSIISWLMVLLLLSFLDWVAPIYLQKSYSFETAWIPKKKSSGTHWVIFLSHLLDCDLKSMNLETFCQKENGWATKFGKELHISEKRHSLGVDGNCVCIQHLIMINSFGCLVIWKIWTKLTIGVHSTSECYFPLCTSCCWISL